MNGNPAGPKIVDEAHVLVPVANATDARASAQALVQYSPERITVLHVVEKGEGVPDKRSLEQSEALAFEAVDTFRETFPDADHHVVYNRDVVEGILDAADECEADAIAFRPRGGSRLVQFLTGDKALRLVTEADRPVISFPYVEDPQ